MQNNKAIGDALSRLVPLGCFCLSHWLQFK
jgi:hypothetical protein